MTGREEAGTNQRLARLEGDIGELKQNIAELTKNMASLLQTRQPGEQPGSGRPQGDEGRAHRPTRKERQEEGDF